MIGKILGMLFSLVGALCVATVIAAATLAVFYSQSWKVSRERWVQAVAILQGKSPESLLPPPPAKKDTSAEQPAYDQVLEAQGLKSRDMEQRELSLRTLIRQFQEELNKIAEEKKRVQAVRDDLQQKLDDLGNAAKNEGLENVAQTLQTLKPKQAKELLRKDSIKATSTSWSSSFRACRTASGPRSSQSSKSLPRWSRSARS